LPRFDASLRTPRSRLSSFCSCYSSFSFPPPQSAFVSQKFSSLLYFSWKVSSGGHVCRNRSLTALDWAEMMCANMRKTKKKKTRREGVRGRVLRFTRSCFSLVAPRPHTSLGVVLYFVLLCSVFLFYFLIHCVFYFFYYPLFTCFYNLFNFKIFLLYAVSFLFLVKSLTPDCLLFIYFSSWVCISFHRKK
jgi:hypothetical protein